MAATGAHRGRPGGPPTWREFLGSTSPRAGHLGAFAEPPSSSPEGAASCVLGQCRTHPAQVGRCGEPGERASGLAGKFKSGLAGNSFFDPLWRENSKAIWREILSLTLFGGKFYL